MRSMMRCMLGMLSILLLAAAPGAPSAGIGDSPDSLEVGGSAPGSSPPGGADPGGGQPGGDGTGSGGGTGAAAGAGGGAAAGAGGVDGTPGGVGSAPGTDQAAPPGGIDAFEPSWSLQPLTDEPCILLSRRPGVSPNSELGLEWDLRTLRMMVDPRVLGRSDRFCTSAAADGAAAGPHAAATAFVRSIRLPRPELSAPPGIALTGLTTYLLISGQEGFGVTEDLPGWGRLSVRFANVATVIDWGDGNRAVVEDGRRGAPFAADPDRQITHVYDHRDPDTEVVVTTLWRASWGVGGHAGTVHGLMTRNSLALPVRSFEAVRVAPDA